MAKHSEPYGCNSRYVLLSLIQDKAQLNGMMDQEFNKLSKKYPGWSPYNCYIRGKGGHTDVILLDLSSDNDIFNTIANGDNIAQVDWMNQLFSHYYYIKDHLGDVRMIMDENGNPQVWDNYYPFGEEMPGLNTVNAGPDDRYGFTSKELDAETSLYYFGARYYDSWSGTWMSVDA